MKVWKIGIVEATKHCRALGMLNWDENFVNEDLPFGIYSETHDGIIEIEFYGSEEARDGAYEDIKRTKGKHVSMMGDFK